jgi:hypothetical protein
MASQAKPTMLYHKVPVTSRRHCNRCGSKWHWNFECQAPGYVTSTSNISTKDRKQGKHIKDYDYLPSPNPFSISASNELDLDLFPGMNKSKLPKDISSNKRRDSSQTDDKRFTRHHSHKITNARKDNISETEKLMGSSHLANDKLPREIELEQEAQYRRRRDQSNTVLKDQDSGRFTSAGSLDKGTAIKPVQEHGLTNWVFAYHAVVIADTITSIGT